MLSCKGDEVEETSDKADSMRWVAYNSLFTGKWRIRANFSTMIIEDTPTTPFLFPFCAVLQNLFIANSISYVSTSSQATILSLSILLELVVSK